MRSICLITITTSVVFFIAGARWGIFQQTRLLGSSLRLTVLNFLFAGTILFALLLGTSRWRSLILLRPLRFLGYISYGTYLIHMLVFAAVDYVWIHFFGTNVEATATAMLAKFAVALTTTIGLAYLSRRFFEEQFLRLKDRIEPKPSSTDRFRQAVPVVYPATQPQILEVQ